MEAIGETKELILSSCVEPKRWTSLKEITGKSDPTLFVHVNDLKTQNLLIKNDEGMYETTKSGIEHVQLVRHVRAPIPKGKMSPEVLKMIKTNVILSHLNWRKKLEVILTPELSITLGLNKGLSRIYYNVGLAIRNSIIMWLPKGLEPNKDVYKAVNQLIAKQIKLSKTDEQRGNFRIVIDFNLPLALDYIIREEEDEQVKKDMMENRDKILQVLYKKWDKIFK